MLTATAVVTILAAGTVGLSEDSAASTAFPQHVMARLSAGRSGGELEGRVAWSAVPPVDANEGRWSVEFVAEIDGASLLQRQRTNDLDIGIYGYIVSADGALIGHINRLETLRAPDYGGLSAWTGLRVIHRIDLQPGIYEVRLLIEEATTRRYFLSATDLEVPMSGLDDPALLRPLVADISRDWVVLETTLEAPASRPVTVEGRGFLPLPTVRMVAGEATDLVVVGAGLEDGFLITARIIDSHGVDRARPTVSLGERVRDGGHGDVMIHATIAPTELAPGRYSLLLRVDNRSSDEPLSRVLRVEVASSQQPNRTAASEEPVPQTAAESLELQAREIGSVSAQTVALLLSGQRGGEIAGSLIWTVSPRISDDGLSEVLVFVDTDGRTLLEEHTDLQLDVGFFAYVFSDEGHLVDHLAEGLSLDLESYEEILLARGLKFAGRFSLPPGAYFVRLLVRNQNSGRLFLTQARIDVPDEQGGERVLLPPIFEEQRGGWIVARQSNIEEGGVGVELSEEIVLPASRVVVESRQQTPFFLGGAGWNNESPVTARVADSQGRQLAEPTLIIDGGVGSVDGSIRFFHAVLDPLDLPPGFYTLEVTLDDETTGARLSRYVPLAVVVRRGPLVLQAELSVSGNPVLLPDGTTAISAPTVSEAEFAARYADALYLLGEGDRYAARDAVVELERSAAKNGGRRDLARISKVERQVVRELAEADADVLRPICLLHRDVFRQHLAFGDDRLADIAWPLAAELAETVNQQSTVGDSPFFAETLLVSLAADLIRAAAVTSAIELLDRAIAIAPDDPSALLALGATYERSGRYEEAIGPLRSLVREHPGNSEGELRLAVNLARDGKVDEAKTHFRHLIEDSAPTWMTVLAYQELARLEPLLMAEAVLAEGVERYPNNQALRVQLAFVLDSRGKTDEATQLVEDVCRRASAPETSPRVRYPTWPSLGIEGKIVRFEEETEILLPALVASLDARAVPESPEDAT